MSALQLAEAPPIPRPLRPERSAAAHFAARVRRAWTESGLDLRLFVAALPGRFLLLLIGIYQRALSPLLPVVSLGTCACRFSPTCSHYAADAIRRHGALAGTSLALRRLLKCTPLHPGGFDPVPPAPRKVGPPVCYPIRPG